MVTRTALGARFEEAAETLGRQFPAYTEALTLPGIIDCLFAVGFLGVRRGNDVVFGGGGALPVQRHEAEFHVHPCFREALGATSAVDLHRYRGIRNRYRSGYPGNTVRTGSLPSRSYRLLDELARSCHSIQAQVDRAVTLMPETRSDIARSIARVRAEADGHIDPEDSVLMAAHDFASLAAQLRASGLDGTAGGGGVAQRMDDEARRLRRLAGGSFGSSGNSGGY